MSASPYGFRRPTRTPPRPPKGGNARFLVEMGCFFTNSIPTAPSVVSLWVVAQVPWTSTLYDDISLHNHLMFMRGAVSDP